MVEWSKEFMSSDTDLERLQQQVQKARVQVHLSEIKVEGLRVSVEEIERFKRKIKFADKRLFRREYPALREFSVMD